MNDNERKEIIKEIKNELNDKKSLCALYKKLKELTNDPSVIEYLQLLENINRIESDIEKYRSPINGSLNDSLNERINFHFRVNRFSCNHDIWLYVGSFYKYINFENEEDFFRYNFEDLNTDFSYNKYICLECGKEVKISKKDWKKFESSHLILKDQNKETKLDTDHYTNKYYQLLYRNSVKKSQKTIIEEFEKQKVLKK